MTSDVLKTIKIRDSFFKYKQKYPNDTKTKDLYELYKKKVKDLVWQAKKNFCDKTISNHPSDSRKLWTLYKKIMYNKSESKTGTHIKTITHNNKVIENPHQISDLFNTFFVNVTDTLDIDSSPIDEQYLDNFSRNIFSSFRLNPTNLIEVKDAIDSLKSSSATGHDCISAKFVKKFSTQLCPMLVHFINKSFLTSTFPDSLKSAVVTPIYKGGSATNATNYRPISVLSTFSKIFEKIIKNRLTSFLRNNAILHQEQYGFEENSNTTAACLALTDFVTRSMDKGKYTACIFIDLQKAFDCVDHEILLYKLSKLNLSNKDKHFFETYLLQRKQSVRVNDRCSNFMYVKKGVPQGSILGPDLFKIYIDDITHLALNGSIQLYADDAVIKYSIDSESELKGAILSDLAVVEEWLQKNKLSLNIKKTKVMLFQNKTWNNFTINYKHESLELVEHFNYLGLVIDNKLKWFSHIDHVIKKISPYIFILRRLRKFFSKDILYSIFSSYISSHLCYLNPIWCRTTQSYITKLDVLLKKAIKTIHGYPLRYPTHLLYTNQYISFDNLCKRELYLIAFKIVNNKIKHNFILNRNIDFHNYNTRNKSNFYVSLFKTDKQKNNCLYNCLQAFNNLPSDIKEIQSINVFKKRITMFLIN